MVETGQTACNEQFPLFLQCFPPFWGTFCHFHQIQNCHLQTVSVGSSVKFVAWEWVKKVQETLRLNFSLLTEQWKCLAVSNSETETVLFNSFIKRQNFRPVQIESIYRRQSNCD